MPVYKVVEDFFLLSLDAVSSRIDILRLDNNIAEENCPVQVLFQTD